MFEAENLAVVERFFHEMLDKGNRAIEPELFTEDSVRRFPGETRTGNATVPPGAPPHTSFRTTIHDMFASGDRVAARITHEVTYGADISNFPRIGPIQAAGKSVYWDATVFFRFRDGRICDEWVARDELGILQRLGVVKAPAASGD